MPKFRCNVYHEYCYTTEVEAKTMEEAYDKAFAEADKAPISNFEWSGYKGGNATEIVNGEWFNQPQVDFVVD